MGVLECHQSTPLNKMVELKNLSMSTTGKKRYSRLSVGCAVLAITTEKKKIQSSICWVRGSGDYDRKKRYSRLSDGLCCCIVFCNGGKF